MFRWLRRVLGGSKRDRKKRHRSEGNFTHRNPPAQLPPLRPQLQAVPDWRKTLPYKKGERIGANFDIHKVLGRGGFGIVYLVYDLELKKVFALKTFRDELLADPGARTAFKREASRWVELGQHPYILSAHKVLEILNRHYVRMDYIAPDEEGRVSLGDHLGGKVRKEIGFEQQLTWGIQFCLGMEHANKCGITCHRDIKPANILITAEGVLRISDFGLAMVSQKSVPRDNAERATVNRSDDGNIGLSIFQAGHQDVCGTPGYIAPEVYRGEMPDVRSDIYSFGLVLWQMAAQSSRPPFIPDFSGDDLNEYLRAIYAAQSAGQLPLTAGPLQPVIAKCLHFQPGERYRSFAQLRADLEPLLQQVAGKTVALPSQSQQTAGDWHTRGISMLAVGRNADALEAFNQALQLEPDNTQFLHDMAVALTRQGRTTECIFGYDQVLKRNPKHLYAWYNKGLALESLKQDEAAQACFEQCISISKNFYQAWYGKAHYLVRTNRLDKALAGCDQVIAIHPRHANAWHLKGNIFLRQGRHQEALAMFDEALKRDPLLVAALESKAACLSKIRRLSDAIVCLEAALAINPKLASAWSEKGRLLFVLKKHAKAIECYNQALALEPKSALRWYNKALAEDARGNYKEALAGFSRFLELAPASEKRIPAVRARVQRLRAKSF